MRNPTLALLAAALAFAVMTTAASADAPAPKTFVVVLDTASEVPQCGPATNAARGVAIFRVTDETAGTVEWRLVANNLPGSTTAAHIHLAPEGLAGPVRQALPLTPGAENGVIATGTFTNPTLLAALRATPESYYVNVHSTACAPGVIRGQFGENGP